MRTVFFEQRIRVYSTAAYRVAAAVAVLFGLCPKFGALVAATPGGVLGGITVVLYGMIGLLGAKIWIAHRVDFNDPVNLVSVATGTVMGIGGTSLQLSGTFTVNGIALGTLVTLITYHLLRTRTSRRVLLPSSHHDRPSEDHSEAGQATALAPASPLPPSPASR
ncbi:solute carrier family 23 protein [Streptomyces angustmyceticus]|uniref:solute carrier family 23 protein n=1 Tax=Streptomyces angustmyceticus TaxID=285578 RepID=UPI0036AC264B